MSISKLLSLIAIFLFSLNAIHGQDQDSFVLHSGEIFSVAWNSDGTQIAVQGVGGTWIYSQSGENLGYLEEDTVGQLLIGIADTYTNPWGQGIVWDSENELLFTPHFTRGASLSYMSLRIWQLPDFEPIEVTHPINFGWDNPSISWSAGGEFIAIPFRSLLTPDWCIRVWQMNINHDPVESCEDSIAITDSEWSPNDYTLAIAYADGTIELRDYENVWAIDDNVAPLTNRMNIHDSEVRDLAWHPGGLLIASADERGLITIWNANTGKIIKRLDKVTGSIETLDWNSDGTLLASAGSDAVVRIWDIDNGNLVTALEGHFSTIIDLDWSPDDQFIATASRDGTVRIWG